MGRAPPRWYDDLAKIAGSTESFIVDRLGGDLCSEMNVFGLR